MRTIQTEVFKFSELSERAKETARYWFRQYSAVDGFYAEYVFEDVATIADMMGIDLRQTRKPHADGSHHYAPTIYYSGFSSQGDGACFESTYRYKRGAVTAVMAYAPLDTELHRIARELQAVQKKHFYGLRAATNKSGRYNHSGCMNVTVDYHGPNGTEYETYKGEDEVTQALRDFADWIYARLESEYEYQDSDAVIDESITANAYEFTEHGEIA